MRVTGFGFVTLIVFEAVSPGKTLCDRFFHALVVGARVVSWARGELEPHREAPPLQVPVLGSAARGPDPTGPLSGGRTGPRPPRSPAASSRGAGAAGEAAKDGVVERRSERRTLQRAGWRRMEQVRGRKAVRAETLFYRQAPRHARPNTTSEVMPVTWAANTTCLARRDSLASASAERRGRGEAPGTDALAAFLRSESRILNVESRAPVHSGIVNRYPRRTERPATTHGVPLPACFHVSVSNGRHHLLRTVTRQDETTIAVSIRLERKEWRERRVHPRAPR